MAAVILAGRQAGRLPSGGNGGEKGWYYFFLCYIGCGDRIDCFIVAQKSEYLHILLFFVYQWQCFVGHFIFCLVQFGFYAFVSGSMGDDILSPALREAAR